MSDNDAAFGTVAPPPTAPVNLDFDTGWTALGTVGYGFAEHWRIEGEAGYRHNDVSVTGAVNRNGGELATTSLMANVLYDWNVTDRFMLTAGVGTGAVHQQFDDGLIDQDEDYNFAYQGIVGASYALSPRTDLTLNYRYLRSDNAEFRGAAGPANFYATDEFENHAVTVGLRFDLNADVQQVAYSPLPAAEPPPLPPAPAAPPRQFLVFFGFDKSNLTDEAHRVVADAAAAAKQFGSASIRVVGHADSAGSKGYYQELSERRASAVRQGLIAEGIEAGKITASGRGETELLVKTDDGVKEPQNRRSSIDLEYADIPPNWSGAATVVRDFLFNRNRLCRETLWPHAGLHSQAAPQGHIHMETVVQSFNEVWNTSTAYMETGFYKINAVQGLLIAMVAAFFLGKWSEVFKIAFGATLFHLVLDVMLPVVANNAAFRLPNVVDAEYWRYALALYVGYLLVITIFYVVKRTMLKGSHA